MSEQIELSGITDSLEELVKAADATKVVSKAYGGNAVETSPFHDEAGDHSGKLADTGDVGSVEELMIGKMTDTLLNAGFSASDIVAFMSGKGEEEEGSEEDEEEDEEEASMKSAPSDFRKSLEAFREDPDLADSMDVSPFLEALTAQTATQLDAINKSLRSQGEKQESVNKAQAAATYQIGMLMKGMAEVVQALNERMNLVERRPVAQAKGATTLQGAKPLTKSLAGEAGGGQPLAKSQILNTLTYMNLEKGIRQIHGVDTTSLVTQLEAGNLLDRQTQAAVEDFLVANPGEAEAAKSYR